MLVVKMTAENVDAYTCYAYTKFSYKKINLVA